MITSGLDSDQDQHSVCPEAELAGLKLFYNGLPADDKSCR